MSLIFIDGFDHYANIREKWVVGSVFDNPTFVPGRFGGQALRKQFQNSAGTISKNLEPQTDVYFGCAISMPGINSNSQFRLQDDNEVTRFDVDINADGSVTIQAGGTLATSATGIITTGTTWHYLEAHYIAKDSAGAGGIAEVRVDGVKVVEIDGTVHPTTTGVSDDIRVFEFYDSGTNSPAYKYDDLYILNGSGTENNGYLGDVRISVLYPEADGTNNAFTPSGGGANYSDVDEEIMNSDTDYVESGTVGVQEDYINGSLSGAGTIFGVQVANGTRRTDSGDIRFQNEMIVGGTAYTDGVEHSSNSGTYFIETYIRDTDPSDDGTWTEAKVDAAGSGLKITWKEL